MAASSTRGVMWVLERIPSSCTARQRVDELVLGERAGAQLDLVAARLERLDGDRVDVLEEQDLHGSRVGAGDGHPGSAVLLRTPRGT